MPCSSSIRTYLSRITVVGCWILLALLILFQVGVWYYRGVLEPPKTVSQEVYTWISGFFVLMFYLGGGMSLGRVWQHGGREGFNPTATLLEHALLA